jgi:glutamyl-tRNA synthetase
LGGFRRNHEKHSFKSGGTGVMEGVRVRFAPSPTGHLHIGSVRTALFNWLLARHYNGVFVLRIEDTDRERSKEEFLQTILSDLKWIGLEWDEGAYFQSQRLSIYQEHLQKLVSEGKAYPCFCSPEVLARKREEAQAQKKYAGYDGHCRSLTQKEIALLESQGQKPVFRFRLPEKETLVVKDAVRGRVEFSTEDLEDFVIQKSDGFPMYNFACVVDDHLMKITHVLRGEEHLSNTPRQLLLYKAFGWEPPIFGHLSIILDERRKKLSKREGATYLGEFRSAGFLPEALLNFLALLGWSPGNDEEILPISEIVRRFDLEHIVKSPAIFDFKKLLWMNGEYIRQLPKEELAKRLIPFVKETHPEFLEDEKKFLEAVVLYQERMKTLKEFATESLYLFSEEFPLDETSGEKLLTPQAIAYVQEVIQKLENIPFEASALESFIREFVASKGLKLGDVVQPLRFLLTGKTATPGIFEVMSLLGKEKVLNRLQKKLEIFSQKRVAL